MKTVTEHIRAHALWQCGYTEHPELDFEWWMFLHALRVCRVKFTLVGSWK